MFSCLPDCQLSELGAIDWLWLLAFGVFVYASSRLWARWAFSYNKYPFTSLRWHAPRFIYIAFVTAMLTVVPVYTFLGEDAGYWYSRILYFPTTFIAYVAWLLVELNDPEK
ncbi:MAG: hypothetical protein LRY66_01385 [Saccharospirillaceae bacterium]|nr:hypothetical protein [Saccharospirillaceae bacterium]MCD8530020.1 hypothetical protein [Saccharospirillaceae bacterium]